MELGPHVAHLRDHLALAVETSSPEARALADQLTAALEPVARLVLLEALSAAAAEITQEMAPGSVDVRLVGREPRLVVTMPPPTPEDRAEPVHAETEAPVPTAADGAVARINLRLPQDLKDRVDDAARRSGLSVNSWLVRATAAALPQEGGPEPTTRSAAQAGQRYRGWVR